MWEKQPFPLPSSCKEPSLSMSFKMPMQTFPARKHMGALLHSCTVFDLGNVAVAGFSSGQTPAPYGAGLRKARPNSPPGSAVSGWRPAHGCVCRASVSLSRSFISFGLWSFLLTALAARGAKLRPDAWAWPGPAALNNSQRTGRCPVVLLAWAGLLNFFGFVFLFLFLFVCWFLVFFVFFF